jgi:hypothetical protein
MVEFVKAHGGNALYWINLTELPEVMSYCKTTKSQALREKLYNRRFNDL